MIRTGSAARVALPAHNMAANKRHADPRGTRVRAIEVRNAIDNGSSRLKAILQSELDDASFGGGADDLAESGAQSYARDTEISVVEGVEQFGAELHGVPFGDGEVLAQIEIEVEHSRGAENADTGVAVNLIRCEVGLRRIVLNGLEGAAVDPVIDVALIGGEGAVGEAVGAATALSADAR